MQSPNFANVKSDYYRNRFQAILASSPYFKKFTACSLKHKKQKETNKRRELSKRPVAVRCDLCDYTTDRASNLRRHLGTMHRAEPSPGTLTCCGETFPDKGSYRLHSRTAHKNGHECQTCHRIFTRRALLRRHQSVHTGIKEFGCHLCTYATSHKSNLERHFKIHVNGKTKSLTPRPKFPRRSNYPGATFRSLTGNWLKKRRAIKLGAGLHPDTSVPASLMRTCDQFNRASKTSETQFSTTFTALSGLDMNKPKISHSIESILSRPNNTKNEIVEPAARTSWVKNKENGAQVKPGVSSSSTAEISDVQIKGVKNEVPTAIQQQLPGFMSTLSTLVNGPFQFPLSPYLGHMSNTVLAHVPQFQFSNSSMYMNQSQDLRMYYNYDYNTASALASTYFQGVANISSLRSPQYNYASEGNRLYHNTLNDTSGALPYSLYLNSYNLLYQMQKAVEPPAELINQKEHAAEVSNSLSAFGFVEKKEPPFTCFDNALAPINTSFINNTNNMPPPDPKPAANVRQMKRCAEGNTPYTNPNAQYRKSQKRPREYNGNSFADDDVSTFTRVENLPIPLKKRRENVIPS